MPIDREAAATAIDSFLRALGRDPATEPDLRGTGARVADAFADELCAGYAVDTRALLQSNKLVSSSPGLVVVRDISVTLMCPHHLLPASGTVTVAFEPNGALVGLGAVTALVFAYARRLILQELMGESIASDLAAVLSPRWVGCRALLSHGCMVARGERATGTRVETVALVGAITDDQVARAHQVLGVGR